MKPDVKKELQRRSQCIVDALEKVPPDELPKDPDTAFAVLLVGVMMLKAAGHSQREITAAASRLFDIVKAERRS